MSEVRIVHLCHSDGAPQSHLSRDSARRSSLGLPVTSNLVSWYMKCSLDNSNRSEICTFNNAIDMGVDSTRD